MVSLLTLGTALTLAGPVDSDRAAERNKLSYEQSVSTQPRPQRRTALGLRLSVFNSGFALRQHWSERFSTDLLGYTLFGRGHGQYRAGLQLRYTFIKGDTFWFHLLTPAFWKHKRSDTYDGVNFMPDSEIASETELSVGAGLGVEVFLNPITSLAFDFPFIAMWDSRENRVTNHRFWGFDWGPSPEFSIHVYFR